MADEPNPAPAADEWDLDDPDDIVGRADLSDSPEGRALAAAFIACFGDFVTGTVRPTLREVAVAGGEPQLLMNGLAQLLRAVADAVEFPVGEARPAAHDLEE